MSRVKSPIRSSTYSPIRSPFSLARRGLFETPGSKTADISTLVISRSFRPSPTPAPTDPISIVGGTYQLYIAGAWTDWTSEASTWGQVIADYLGLDGYEDIDNYTYAGIVGASKVRVACTSSDLYSTPDLPSTESTVLTVGAVEYTFVVTAVCETITPEVNGAFPYTFPFALG